MPKTLPPELYQLIVETIPSGETPLFLSLLITSKALHYASIRRLYEVVRFTSWLKNGEKKKRQQFTFFSTIYNNRRLALLVCALDLSAEADVDDTEYWNSLADALHALTKLKRLRFEYNHSYVPDEQNIDPTTTILKSCTFQLETFSWTLPHEPALITFLESQPLIKNLTLKWDDVETVTPLLPTALSNLRVLVGGQAVIELILPGRTVTHLHWVPEYYDDTALDMSHIGPALSSVQVLNYGLYFETPEFHLIAGYLTNLEVLHWRCDGFEPLLACLGYLKRVRKIVLDPQNSKYRIDFSSYKQFFDAIQSLREFVGLTHYGAWKSWVRLENEQRSIEARWIDNYVDWLEE